MYEKIFFMGGFHRSGSTLLSSILCQNPNFHIEGKSALCQLMWDASESIKNNKQFLEFNNKYNFDKNFISQIPQIYYNDNTRPLVIDKNPWWTDIKNTEIITNYINKDFKMIILYRSPIEILRSFVSIFKKNNKDIDIPYINKFYHVVQNYQDFERIVESKNKKNYFFVDYEDIIINTKDVVYNIYDFLEIDKYHHNFKNIKRYSPVKEDFEGMNGLYEIRSQIEKSKIDIEVDEYSMQICELLNKKIKTYKELGLC